MVNVYSLLINENLDILEFKTMTDEWLDFIIACRSGKPHTHDIVIGAMANDQIYNTFLVGLTDAEGENVPSKRRNPVVAYVFGRMHYMERRGSGFKKIRDEYRNARHELAPSFYSDSVTFRLTLYKLNYGVPVDAQSEMLESSEDVGFTSKTRENQTREKYNELNRGHDGVYNVEISDVVENQTDARIIDVNVGINGVDVVGKRCFFYLKTAEGGLKTDEGGLKTDEGGLKTDEGGLKNVTSKTADTINKLMQNNPNTTVSDIVNHLCIARTAVTTNIKGRIRIAHENACRRGNAHGKECKSTNIFK